MWGHLVKVISSQLIPWDKTSLYFTYFLASSGSVKIVQDVISNFRKQGETSSSALFKINKFCLTVCYMFV